MNIDIVLSQEQLNSMIIRLKEASVIAFDFETTGLDFISDEILGLAVATDKGYTAYIPVRHDGVDTVSEQQLVSAIGEAFLNPDTTLVAHNLKFDIQFLWKLGIDIGFKCDNGMAADTMIMSYLLDENLESHGLKYLTRTILKVDMKDYGDVVGGKAFREIPLQTAANYAGLDALATLHLYNKFLPQLAAEKLMDVYTKVEMPFLKVLALMEKRGVYVDLDLLNEYEERIEIETKELRRVLYKAAGKEGHEFNLNSNDQLGQVLFSKPPKGFGAPILKMTDGGKKPRKDGSYAPAKPKTDRDVILQLAGMGGNAWVPFCQTLLRYKELAKIDSTYVKGLRELIRADGKIHGSFNQAVTVTGRLSSSSPNLQNQPAGPTWVDNFKPGQVVERKTWREVNVTGSLGCDTLIIPDTLEEMQRLFPKHTVNVDCDQNGRALGYSVVRKVRDLYYNPHGVLIVGDFAQMEMRVMAHFSQDPSLLDAFTKNEDIHKWVASHAYKVKMEQVTKPMRDRAKAVGFGTIYGKTDYGFANDWFGNKPDFWADEENGKVNQKYLKEAQAFLNDFFSAFPGIKNYMDFTVDYCRRYGFVKTLTGRKRRLKDIWSQSSYLKSRAERQAINTKIQGSASDFLKMSQVILERTLAGTGVEQVIQVHDELYFHAPSAEVAERVIPIIKEGMENAVALRVKIVTEPAVVARWGMAK